MINNEPTKTEFQERYSVTLSDNAFDYIKKFFWEICCAKDTKKFYNDIKQDRV